MVRTPLNVRAKNHMHSPYIRALSSKAAEDIARVDALALEGEVATFNEKTDDRVHIHYAAAAALGPRRWLMDTGTPFDIVSVNDVNAEAESHKIKADNSVTLNAVGGFKDVEYTLPRAREFYQVLCCSRYEIIVLQ